MRKLTQATLARIIVAPQIAGHTGKDYSVRNLTQATLSVVTAGSSAGKPFCGWLLTATAQGSHVGGIYLHYGTLGAATVGGLPRLFGIRQDPCFERQ